VTQNLVGLQPALLFAPSLRAGCRQPALLPGLIILQFCAQFSNDALQIFDRWHLIAERLRQPAGHTISGNSDRFGHIAQCVLDDRFAPALTEQQPERRRIRWGPEKIIGGGEIEVQFAGILGFERANLEFNNEVGVQAKVIEEQIDVEGLAIQLKWNLAADESKATPQLEQKVTQVLQ